jgi:hypothetical protein
LKKIVDGKDHVSDRFAAQRMGWSRSYIQKVRVQTLGIQKYMKRSVPFYAEEEEHEAKKRCRKMVTEVFTPGTNDLIVVDDEHYVYLDQSNNVSNMYYNSTCRNVARRKLRLVLSEIFAQTYGLVSD